ncbi:MAG: hypothetical protein ACT6RN_06670 [Agrobacterium sp.]|uniref:hypothetical protein n=1 Tax=Agrobacterium sp. TaxID=361 RepID=UPI004037AC30
MIDIAELSLIQSVVTGARSRRNNPELLTPAARCDRRFSGVDFLICKHRVTVSGVSLRSPIPHPS